MQRFALSGDTTGNFVPVKITATSNATAQTVHLSGNVAGFADFLWVYLINQSDNLVRVNLLKGGVVEPDNLIPVDVPPKGIISQPVMDGWMLKGGLYLKVYTPAGANLVTFDGYADRGKVQP